MKKRRMRNSVENRCLSSIAVVFAVFIVFVCVTVKGVSSTNLRFEAKHDGLDCDQNSSIEVIYNNKAIDSTLRQNGHFKVITVVVNAFSQHFILDLELNRHLFAAGFVQKLVTRDGHIYHNVQHNEEHCYYVGKIRDHPDSAAALSTCSGIVGYFAIGNASYHINPRSSAVNGVHSVCRGRPDAKTKFRCGHEIVSLGQMLNPFKLNRRLKRSFQWPQDMDKKDKVVEIYVAIDKSEFSAQGSDSNAGFRRAKEIVNIASITYQSLGIYLVLVGVEVWSNVDRITVNANDPDATLGQWAAYRMANINPTSYSDIGILITNTTFTRGADGTVAGLSYQGMMCSNRKSASFVGDIYPSASFASTVMNHEIGHVLNLIHDNDYKGQCACDDPTGQCIMNSATNPARPSKTWSQCSKDQLATSFQHGLDICLYNTPELLFQPTQICGNGIVENGEQCDCGNSTSQECNKTCCNTATCQLIAPATCAYGRCCNISTCQILPCGTTCRPKTDDCDLVEYCNGQSALCPNDTHRQDGTYCTVNGVPAYCYDGHCNSRESQCALIWGPGTLVSEDKCFTQLNIRGTYYGNCGLNWLPNVTYKKCQASDAFCGTLQCEDNAKQLSYYQKAYKIGCANDGNITCHSAIFDFGLKVQDPGLVPNGASCGVRKMCVKQKCINVGDVNATRCQTTCRQNEVCNNLGQCQSITAGTSCLQTTTMLSTTWSRPMQSTTVSSAKTGTSATIVQVSTESTTTSSHQQLSPAVSSNDADSAAVVLAIVLGVVFLATLIASIVLCAIYRCPKTLDPCCPP